METPSRSASHDAATSDEEAGTKASERQRTSLLDLAPEIWSKIGYLVIDATPTITSADFTSSKPRPKHPPVTQVCSALRCELLPYFYKHKALVHQLDGPLAAGMWLQAIGPEGRKAIAPFELVAGSEKQIKRFYMQRAELEVAAEAVRVYETLGRPFQWYRVRFI